MVRFLALRGLFRHPARTFLSVLGVGVAGALLFDMQMLSRGLQASLHRILREVGYEVRVTPRGTLPFDTDSTFPDGHRIAAGIVAHPDVDHVAPILGGAVYAARAAEAPLAAFVYGMDPPTEALWRVVDGADLVADDSTHAVVSVALAQALSVGVGDTLLAAGEYVAQLGMLRAPRAYRVAGVAEFHFDLRAQRTFAVGTREAQRLRNEAQRDGLSLIAVALRDLDGAGTDQTARGAAGDTPANDTSRAATASARDPDAGHDVAAWIRDTFPEVEAYSVAEALDAVQGQLSYFNVFSLVLGTVSMVVCVLLVGTIVALSIGERLGELAILRAIGLRRRRLVGLVFAESVLLVVLSLPIAFGVGHLVALWLDTILMRAPSIPVDMSFFVFTKRAALLTLGLLFGAGAVAGLYPAFLVSRLRIAPTLHREVVG
jgi:putative ABC transport system permease protein